jgi:hypothetical protein
MNTSRFAPIRPLAASIALGLSLSGSVRADLLPSGTEVQANTTVLASQWRPAITQLEGGNIVVAWQDDSGAIKFRIFDGNLAAITGELPVDEAPLVSNINDAPKISALAGGDFIVVWQAYINMTSVFDVYARRFDGSGNAVGGEFRVNVLTDEGQGRPCVAQFGDGTIFIAWEHDNGPHTDVVYRIFEEDLDPISSEVVASQETVRDQFRSSVVTLSDGNLALVWDSEPPVFSPGNPRDCWIRLFSPSGPMGDEVRVNTEQDAAQIWTSVAPLPEGGAVAVWWSQDQDGDDGGIFGQRFVRNAGLGRLEPMGDEFLVNTFTAEDQVEPEVTSWADGFLVTWTSENKLRNNGDGDRPTGEDGDGAGVYGRAFGVDGIASGGSVRVNLTTANHQYGGVPVALSGEKIVVAWSSTTDGEDYFDGFENPDNYDEVFLRTLEEMAPVPTTARMSVSPPAAAIFRVKNGRSVPSKKTFQIINSGTGNLSWRIEGAPRWLKITPGSGNLGSGLSAKISVRLNPRALPKRPRIQTSLPFQALAGAEGSTTRRITVVNSRK